MPLAFESESHGTVAFGFFNIASDMLLLDSIFFFAADFCRVVCEMGPKQGDTENTFLLHAYHIDDSAGIGDLQGGISGTHFSGFIGETYKRYPFPEDETNFKQQTDGFKTRDEFARMILDFGAPADLFLYQDKNREQVIIGSYVFSRQNFQRIIQYVIRGGYPQWLDDIAPDYVVKMREAVSLP